MPEFPSHDIAPAVSMALSAAVADQEHQESTDASGDVDWPDPVEELCNWMFQPKRDLYLISCRG